MRCCSGLGIALLRTLRAPVFFPLRALAALYTYLFRGAAAADRDLYLFAFGVPGLRLQRHPARVGPGRAGAVITYGAYLAEVFRAGHRVGAPVAAGRRPFAGPHLPPDDAPCRAAAGVRRVTPPMLNDLVALQKDVGLISLAGPIDAIRAAQIETAETYNYTPYVVAGVLFVLLAIPLIAVTDWVTLRSARRQSRRRPL